MKIRRAASSDKAQLTQLLIAFDKLAENMLSEGQVRVRAFENQAKAMESIVETYLTNPAYFVFVADDEGTLRGYISGLINTKKYRVYHKEGYIEHWFVEQGSQSTGVGKQLFDTLTQEFRNVGCTHLGLDTNLENTKAIEIYEHMGFSKRLVTFFKIL